MDQSSIELLRGLGTNAGLSAFLVFGYALLVQERSDTDTRSSATGHRSTTSNTADLILGRWTSALLGVFFGVVAILVMMVPVSISPGVFFDTRLAVVALAGLYLTTKGALIALLVAIGYRYGLGGAGMLTGVSMLFFSGLAGMAWRRIRPDFVSEDKSLLARTSWLFSLGCIQCLIVLVAMSAWLQSREAPALQQLLPFAFVVLPLATIIPGLLIEGARRLRAREITLGRVARTMEQAAGIFINSRDAMFVIDANKNFVEVNPALCEMTGYSYEELIGNSISMISDSRHSDAFNRSVMRHLRETGVWQGEIWRVRKGGEPFPTYISIKAIFDQQGRLHQEVCVCRDLSIEYRHQSELEHAVSFDPLTGLSNRRHFVQQLTSLLALAEAQQSRVAVCYLDIDKFMEINGRHSQRLGDQALKLLAVRLQGLLASGDLAGRIAGDEFVVALSGFGIGGDPRSHITSLRNTLFEPVLIDGNELSLTACVGYTVFPSDSADPDTLIRHADQAMLTAKEAGINNIAMFDAEKDSRTQSRRESVARIEQAIDQGEMELYFQPKVSSEHRAFLGAECLIRWRHPERGLLAPGAFIPVITGTKVSVALDYWVLRESIRLLADWHHKGLEVPLSINMSVPTLMRQDFIPTLRDLLAEHGTLPCFSLEVELLETETMHDLTIVRRVIETLNSMGVRVSIDDFGTGYSTLTYLQQLPAHVIKIDQSFVRDIPRSGADRTLVQGIIGLAKNFDRQTVAEGVETEEHARWLEQMGCDVLQGYGIARPMPASDLETWIAGNRSKGFGKMATVIAIGGRHASA